MVGRGGRREGRVKKHEEKGVDNATSSSHPSAFPPLHGIYVQNDREGEEGEKDGRATGESIEERERRQQGRINWR